MLFIHLFRNLRVLPVERPGAIRAGHHAEAAANATFGIDEYNAVGPFIGRIDRAHFHARRAIAVEAVGGLPIGRCVFAVLHFQHFQPIFIRRQEVDFLAGVVAFAEVFAAGEIDDHDKFPVGHAFADVLRDGIYFIGHRFEMAGVDLNDFSVGGQQFDFLPGFV